MNVRQVTFEEYDERDPMNFSYKTKWMTTLVACAFAAIVGNVIFLGTGAVVLTETYLCI